MKIMVVLIGAHFLKIYFAHLVFVDAWIYQGVGNAKMFL